jgi:hypothetical protein
VIDAIIWACTLVLIIVSCLGTIVYSVRKVEGSKVERTAMEEGTKQKVIEATVLERREHVLKLEIAAFDRQLASGKSFDWEEK